MVEDEKEAIYGQKLKNLETEYYDLEREIASLKSQMVDDSQASRPKKRGVKPEADYIAKIVRKMKEDWSIYLKMDKNERKYDDNGKDLGNARLMLRN